jgi:hypothetical protein
MPTGDGAEAGSWFRTFLQGSRLSNGARHPDGFGTASALDGSRTSAETPMATTPRENTMAEQRNQSNQGESSRSQGNQGAPRPINQGDGDRDEANRGGNQGQANRQGNPDQPRDEQGQFISDDEAQSESKNSSTGADRSNR